MKQKSRQVSNPCYLARSQSLFSRSLPTSRSGSRADLCFVFSMLLSAFVVKSRLISIFDQIYQQAISVEPLQDKDILRLDRALRAEHERIPNSLRMRPINRSWADSAYLIMSRLASELLFLKGICILHRKKMALGDPTSHSACEDAAMTIIDHILELYREVQPGGHMQGCMWMISSSVVNDFLFAVMVVCLSVINSVLTPGTRPPTVDDHEQPVRSLYQARTMCIELSSRSSGAYRVASAIDFVLSRIPLGTKPSATLVAADTVAAEAPSYYPASTSNLRSHWTPTHAVPPDSTVQHSLTVESFDHIFDNFSSVNWTMFDQYINNWDPV